MNLLSFSFHVFLPWSFYTAVNGAKILVLTPLSTKSHRSVFTTLVEELAARGHQITFVSPILSPKQTPNVTEIAITKNAEAFALFQETIFNSSFTGGVVKHKSRLTMLMKESGENFLKHPETETLIDHGQQFDLAIVNGNMNEVCFMIAPLLAKTTVLLSARSYPPSTPISAPISPATQPVPLFRHSEKMTFFQRIRNFAYIVYMSFYAQPKLHYETERIVWKKIPHAVSLKEAEKDFALLLNNADPVLSPSKAHVPTSIDIGGMHCRPSKLLPKEFETFIESSQTDGFILFSLGSVVPAKMMPIELRTYFLNAFARLRQKVIWKFEEPLQQLPPNVMMTPWTPQQDILGHPKIRLFITHGGLLSLQEAVYHGVPIIGIPIFADQPGNVERIKEFGIGEELDLRTLSVDKILHSINKILNNNSYSETMKSFSDIFRDQPELPVKRAAFWIEYAMRHKGSPHLHNSEQILNSFQFFMLDVIVVIMLTAGLILFISFITIRKLVW